MAYAQPFLRISPLFTIVNTQETAQFDITVGANPAGSVPDAVDLAVLQDIGTAVDALMQASGLAWASFSRFVGIKAAKIAVDGSYAEEPVTWTRGTPLAGSSTSVSAAETVCVSLRSGATLGKGNYGRIYLPHTGLPLQNNSPYTDATSQGTVADAAQAFVEAVNSAVQDQDEELAWRIMSQATGQPQKLVNSIAVGRVIDTQRRRRNALDESYVFRTVAP